MEARKVLIIGDSILKPIVLNESDRYIVSKSVNWAKIEEVLNVKIDNKSRMGATIKHGFKLLKESLEAEQYDVVIIEFGGNDCCYDWRKVAESKETHLPNTGPDEFESTLREMINIANKHGVKPILMTLPPISSSKYYDWFIKRAKLNEENVMCHINDIEVIYRHQEWYTNIVQTVSRETQTEIVDVRKEFLARKDFINLMCEDGSHPNVKGEQIIVDTFVKQFKR